MKHLSFEKVSQETTVFNALLRAGITDQDNELPIDVAIGKGIKNMIN